MFELRRQRRVLDCWNGAGIEKNIVITPPFIGDIIWESKNFIAKIGGDFDRKSCEEVEFQKDSIKADVNKESFEAVINIK